jgi:hypothetical protein
VTEVLPSNFLLLLSHFGCTTDQRSIPFGYLLNLLAQGHQSPSAFSGVYTEVNGAADKGSEDATMADVQTPLKAF